MVYCTSISLGSPRVKWKPGSGGGEAGERASGPGDAACGAPKVGDSENKYC